MGLDRWYITEADKAKIADAIGRLLRFEVENYEPTSCEVGKREALDDTIEQIKAVLYSAIKNDMVVEKCIAGFDLTKVHHLSIGKGGEEDGS